MLGNLFQPKFFILFYDWYMNLTFSSKMYFRIYVFFVFFNYYFSKKHQFGELFQKRFAGGICDFGGYGSCIAWHPIYEKNLGKYENRKF